ncbi:hypothetical protein ElyMa_005469700 [Elysia marginata]|uniref:Uncharacterized protein n=1 Tax=Elysia marginata TaxID=1093978 RepID=A0AAV4ER08_9GAST|nr:hypothetical protein ElyMa_005469700 [Elysia marginata]
MKASSAYALCNKEHRERRFTESYSVCSFYLYHFVYFHGEANHISILCYLERPDDAATPLNGDECRDPIGHQVHHVLRPEETHVVHQTWRDRRVTWQDQATQRADAGTQSLARYWRIQK